MLKLVLNIIVFSVVVTFNALGQSELKSCYKNFDAGFILNEKEYKIVVKENEAATFHITFLENFTYRLSACTNINDGQLVLEVYDLENNLLFSNEKHEYSAYWDFKCVTTMECVIKIQVSGTEFQKGIVYLLSGYKI